MTAPGQWSTDNPFVDQQPTQQWSDDNPFVDQAPQVFAAPMPTAAEQPKPQTQSDFLAGFVGGVTGSVPKSFGSFLQSVGLEELGDPIVEAGSRGEQAAEAFGARVKTLKDVGSISDAIDYAQFQVGSGLASTLPSLVGGAAGAAVAGPIGLVVGALVPSYMQNTGQIMEELKSLGKEDQKALALQLGVPVALLDMITPVDLVNRVIAKQVAKAATRGLLKQAARSAGSEAVTEGSQESLQYGGTRLGTSTPISLRELAERAIEGSVAGGLTGGTLGAGASVFGKHRKPDEQRRTVDPVTLKPPVDPSQEPTEEQKRKRQEEIDRLKAQEKANAEKKTATQSALLKAVNAWNTLSVDQRRAVVTGLAADQYSLRWKDLTKEAKTAVRAALGAAPGPNLDTSQTPPTDGSAPSAQGVGPAPEVVSQLELSIPEQQAPPQVRIEQLLAEHKALWNRRIQLTDAEQTADVKAELASIDTRIKQGVEELDKLQTSNPGQTRAEQQASTPPALPEQELTEVDYMDLPALRRQRTRAEVELRALDERAKVERPETLQIEREFWTKYKADIERAMEVKLRKPPTKESLDKLTEKPPEGAPDIAPLEPPPAEPSRFQVGSPEDRINQLEKELDKIEIEEQLDEAADITKMEKDLDDVRKKLDDLEAPNRTADQSHETSIENQLLSRGRVPKNINTNLRLTEIARREWAHRKDRKPLKGEETFDEMIEKLRQGKLPDAPIFDNEKAIKALLNAGAKYLHTAEDFLAEARATDKKIQEAERLGETSHRVQKLYREQEYLYFQANIRSGPQAREEAKGYILEQLNREGIGVERELWLRQLLRSDAELRSTEANAPAYQWIHNKRSREWVKGPWRVSGREGDLFRLTYRGQPVQSFRSVKEAQTYVEQSPHARRFEERIDKKLALEAAELTDEEVLRRVYNKQHPARSEAIQEAARRFGDATPKTAREKQLGEEIDKLIEKINAGRKKGEDFDLSALEDELAVKSREYIAELKKRGPDDGASPALPSAEPSPPAPTGAEEAIPREPGPTPGGSEATPIQLTLPQAREMIRNADLVTAADVKDLSDESLYTLLREIDSQEVGSEEVLELANMVEVELNNRQKAQGTQPTPDRIVRGLNYSFYSESELQYLGKWFDKLAKEGKLTEEQYQEAVDQLTQAFAAKRERSISERLPEIEQRADDLTQVEHVLRAGDPDVELAKITFDSMPSEDKITLFGPEFANAKWADLTPAGQAKLVQQQQEALNALKTPEQVDEMIDVAEQGFEQGIVNEPAFRAMLHRLADIKRAIKARAPKPIGTDKITQPPLKFKLPDTMGKDLNKFTADQLKNVKKSIAGLLQSPDVKGTPVEQDLKNEMNRIFDYESEKRDRGPDNLGDLLKDESGELRFTGWRLPKRRAVKKAVRSGLPHYEQTIADRIGLEEDPVNPFTLMDRIRQAYTRIFRHGAPIGSAERLSGKKLAVHESPYMLAQMSSRFLTQAEEFLRGQGPFVPDDAGGFVPTGTPALSEISAMVGDDIERLGWLAMARRELYERAERGRSIGLDPIAAELQYRNTPQAYHDAADALAQYNHDLASYALWGELISEEVRALFTTLFYAPIKRIFGSEIEGSGASSVTPRGRSKPGVGGENPIKRYRGSTRRMVNPYETTVDMTARVIRAANQNKVAALLVKLAKADPDAYRGVLEPASSLLRNKIKAALKVSAEKAKAEALESGVEISLSEAERFVGTLGDEALAIRDNVLNVWVDGQLEHWVMHPELAYGMKSLTPQELGLLAQMAGVPAQVQRFTIVNDPTFILTMSMVDTFQAFVNSRYGFIPVVSSFKGWWAAITNSPDFTEYRRAGGGLSSLTSRQYAKSETSLHDIVGATRDQSPVAQAIQQLKTYHPLEAWRTLVAPVAEAARVGEYLAARGRGATVIEAVFAAKSVTGNYSQQGGAMRALNHMTVFLNPALQVLDKTARVIAENPVRWFLRSSTVGIAAWVLYMANADDEEIQDLRQTPGGQRYFFIRMPDGSIGKIRKPFLEGAIFAGGIEAAMDSMREQNPEAFRLWIRAMLQEMVVYQLPAIGVIPAQYWANKDFLSGAPIRPEADQALEPMFQSRALTGSTARIIGKATNSSPAVIEWLARSQFGYLGGNVIAALDGAIEWHQSGEWPIAEELPFVNRMLARYPTSNVRPIREFYEHATKVERVAKTLEYMAMNEPEMLESYIEGHEQEIALMDAFTETRSQLAEFRKAIEDVNTAEASVIAPSVKRQFTDEFMRLMIEMARATNLMHQTVTEAVKQTNVP